MDTDLLSDTFVDLADTMVADFDIIDFLHLLTDRSVALLAASAAGVVLADPRGELRLAAASSEQAGLLELFQLQNDQGPCLECFRTGQPVTAADLAGPAPRWPRFADAATRSSPRGSASTTPAADAASRATLRSVSRCRKSITSKSATIVSASSTKVSDSNSVSI